MRLRIVALLIILSGVISSCSQSRESENFLSNVSHPEWISDAVIYEVNVRQFTPEGTFAAFSQHLPRLKELGVEILWFMPIHPIGVKDRKGELGSYYSVVDYKAVNPEFGTLEDFKNVVNAAHSMGMKVIIDWVANHTSRDAVWLTQNPEWYVMDTLTGAPVAPFDWSDVAKLDFSNPEVHLAMFDAMLFWVKEANIDGFRCDVAAEVPVEFWNMAVAGLKKENPNIFMLAEAEQPSLQIDAFNAYYGWHFHHIKNKLAKGEYILDSIRTYMERGYTRFPNNTIPMFFTSNHDENSWNGTEFQRLGEHARQMAALTFVMPGMPLIYNGQEVGFNRMLEFFVKDSIDWNSDSTYTSFYKALIDLKKSNRALDTPGGGTFEELATNNPADVYAIQRIGKNNSIIAIFNFSKESQDIVVQGTKKGKYSILFQTQQIEAGREYKITLEPYAFQVLYK